MSDPEEHPSTPPRAPEQAPPQPPQQGWQPAPPPMMPYPAAPPPPKQQGAFKRGFGLGAGAGLGLGAVILVLGIIGSLLTGLVFAGVSSAASSVSGKKQTKVEGQKTVWGKDTAKDKLRAIPISGAIMTDEQTGGFALSTGTYGYEVADVLDQMKPEDAGGVVLMMNTPGGTVTGAKAIADAVDRYKQRTGKPVYAFVSGMSASGGMYAMVGADEIISDHGALIGSVGVIMGPFEQYTNVTSSGNVISGQVTAGKIDSQAITAGKYKDIGSAYRPMTAEEKAMLQGDVNRMYDDFVTHVTTKRPKVTKDALVNTLGASIFDEKKAQEVGYIDGIMNRDEAMRHFATKAGLDPENTKVVQSTGPTGIWALLGTESRAWGVAPAAKPEGGQPARVTASICTDKTTPLVWYGSTAGVCS